MGLFNWFRTNQSQMAVNTVTDGQEIPKDVFIEERDPQEQAPSFSTNGEVKGIEAIYAFLQTDYELKGYNDALVNEDQSNKADGIKRIKLDLEIIMDREIHSLNKSIMDI